MTRQKSKRLATAVKQAVKRASALGRLRKAAVVIANILDAGRRDPSWNESQELEEAAIAYGRAVRKGKVT